MVVFDATALMLLLKPDAEAPNDPDTGKPVENPNARMAHLVQQLEESRTKILVPTPALSEILVRAGRAGPDYLQILNSSAAFKPMPFDERAAVEVAHMTREAISDGDKRGDCDGTWAKIKYDRQIVAIARVEGVSAIYSDDGNVRTLAEGAGISVICVSELPLPPEEVQRELVFEEPGEADDDEG